MFRPLFALYGANRAFRRIFICIFAIGPSTGRRATNRRAASGVVMNRNLGIVAGGVKTVRDL